MGLRNLKTWVEQTGEVKVTGWSGETSGTWFSGVCNIRDEDSCENQFISIYVYFGITELLSEIDFSQFKFK